MAQEVNVDINIGTTQAQKDVKNLDKDLTGLGATAKNTGKDSKDAGNDIKSMGGGAEKAGKSAKKSSKGWNILSKAIAMTGIGALVMSLFALGDVIRGNQKVMDAFNVIMESLKIVMSDIINFVVDGVEKFAEWSEKIGGLSGVFDKVKEKIMNFGGMIKDFVLDSVKKTIEGLGMLGNAISLVFKGEFSEAAKVAKEGAKTLWNANPIVNLTKKTVKYAKEVIPKIIEGTKDLIEKGKEYITNVTDQAGAIVDTRNQVILMTSAIKAQQKELQSQMDMATKVRDNDKKTFEDRLKASQEIQRISDEMRENEEALLQTKIDNAEAELRVNSDNIEMLTTLNDLKAEMTALENAHTLAILDETQAHHDLIKTQSDSIHELNELNLQGYDREMADLKKYYKERLEQARLAGKGEVAVKEEYNRKKEEIESKYVRKSIKAGADFIGALAGTQEKGSKSWKKMAKAQALINTYLGVTAALKDPEMPFVARLLNAGTQLLMGMNNVKAISKTKMEGAEGDDGNTEEDTVSGGGGGGGGQLPEITSLIPEQLVENVAGANGGAVQAYVVENDISNSQALQQELEIQSTL